MWIIDPRVGLLSVVAVAGDGPDSAAKGRVSIRARSRRHLGLLQKRCPSLAEATIIKSAPGRDYPCRMIVERGAWVEAMTTLASSLDTKNVKSSAHRNEAALGRDFVSAMHTVHATLARVKDQSPVDG